MAAEDVAHAWEENQSSLFFYSEKKNFFSEGNEIAVYQNMQSNHKFLTSFLRRNVVNKIYSSIMSKNFEQIH